MFDRDSDSDEPTDFKYKRKKRNPNLGLNKSVPTIKNLWNSNYMTSTWEDKVQNSGLIDPKKKQVGSKPHPTTQVFNYTIDWNVDLNRQRSPKVNKFKRDINMISSYKVNKVNEHGMNSWNKIAVSSSPSKENDSGIKSPFLSHYFLLFNECIISF